MVIKLEPNKNLKHGLKEYDSNSKQEWKTNSNKDYQSFSTSTPIILRYKRSRRKLEERMVWKVEICLTKWDSWWGINDHEEVVEVVEGVQDSD